MISFNKKRKSKNKKKQLKGLYTKEHFLETNGNSRDTWIEVLKRKRIILYSKVNSLLKKNKTKIIFYSKVNTLLKKNKISKSKWLAITYKSMLRNSKIWKEN